jgi:hypothetical protein
VYGLFIHFSMPPLPTDFHLEYLSISNCVSIMSPLLKNFQNCHKIYQFLLKLFSTSTDFTACSLSTVQISRTVTHIFISCTIIFDKYRFYCKFIVHCSNFHHCHNTFISCIITFHKYKFYCKFLVHCSN